MVAVRSAFFLKGFPRQRHNPSMEAGPARLEDRVNVHEDYEVQYWCGKFGCTPDQLKVAVKKVGVIAKDVEAELKRK